MVIKLKKFFMPKKATKPKTSCNKDFINIVFLNRFKVLEKKEIDEKKQQHDEQ